MKFEPKDYLAQTALKSAGYDPGALDGLWGVKSQMALQAWCAAREPKPAQLDGEFDPRSEANILSLLPEAQAAARKFLAAAKAAMLPYGLDVRITSGNRTYAEQDALYAQGRTKPGPVVTNARGGQSNHNHGIAWDITLFRGKDPIYESPHYAELAAIGRNQGLDCGAYWKNIKDEPHYVLKK